LGLLTVLGVPWRLTYLVVIALTLLSVLLLVRVRWPETSVEAAAVPGAAARHRGTRMPARFWLYWCVMLSGVAGEFCTTFWAGDLLAQRLSISPGGATACVAALIAGMFAGRLGSGRLVLRHPPVMLLLGALPLAVVGWLVTWSATAVPAAVVGLVVLGLGLAPVYPLGNSLLVQTSGSRADYAYAISARGTGVAIGVAPLVLGALADRFGTHNAFALVPTI